MYLVFIAVAGGTDLILIFHGCYVTEPDNCAKQVFKKLNISILTGTQRCINYLNNYNKNSKTT